MVQRGLTGIYYITCSPCGGCEKIEIYKQHVYMYVYIYIYIYLVIHFLFYNCSEVSGDREVQRTMLELLNQLDGFSSDERIKVLC